MAIFKSGWMGGLILLYIFINLKENHLPPTTRHVNIISSPSSIGPRIVPFSWRPQRFKTKGGSGGTEKEKKKKSQ